MTVINLQDASYFNKCFNKLKLTKTCYWIKSKTGQILLSSLQRRKVMISWCSCSQRLRLRKSHSWWKQCKFGFWFYKLSLFFSIKFLHISINTTLKENERKIQTLMCRTFKCGACYHGGHLSESNYVLKRFLIFIL